jgi:hypothetical protein
MLKALFKETEFQMIFESQKVTNEVSWTKNLGKFGTKYKIPLQFLLSEFTPSCEIPWKFPNSF